MLTNWTNQTAATRGTAHANVKSFVAGRPGMPLCLYSLSSIPVNLPFDGVLNQRQRETLEVHGISDYRQEKI